MREKGDYSRAEEYLEEIKEQIEYENGGTPYSELSKEEQVQSILDHFFKGIPQYWGSARSLRVGMQRAQAGIIAPVKISRIMFRGGRKSICVRDAKTGRFKQWVKE